MSSSTSLARSRSLRKPGNVEEPNRTDTENVRSTSPSRLPVKGIPGSRAAAAAPNTSSTGSGSSAGSGRSSRPISGSYGRPAPTRQAQKPGTSSAAAASTGTTTSRPPITTRNRPPQRPTSSSGLPSSSTTAARTTSAATASAAAAARGHARAKSSVTALTGATTLRPPSQAPTSTASQAGATEKPRSSTGGPRALHQRQSSLSSAAASTRHTRSRSTATAAITTTATTQPSSASSSPTFPPGAIKTNRASDLPPPSSSSQSQQQQQQQQNSRLRPTFSTLQQHYSPAKSLAPKPLTATYLAPPSPSKLPANVAASAETARLQTELLQLHLAHRAAPAVDAAWRDSARSRLEARFRALACRDAEIARLESDAAEQRDAAALRSWAAATKTRDAGGPSSSLEERIQTLDAVLTDVWALGEPGGRYTRTARRFDKWAEEMAEVAAAREAPGTGGAAAAFVSDLDAGWKDECAGLARKLAEWDRQLSELGDVPGEKEAGASEEGGRGEEGAAEGGDDREATPSVARILGACRHLVRDMLAELELMQSIERDAVAREDAWIREAIRDGDGTTDGPRAGAVWRVI